MMKYLHYLILGVMIVLISSTLFAQNYMFDKGESGFHIEGAYTPHEYVPSFNISTAYTYNGRMAIGASLKLNIYDSIHFPYKAYFGPGIDYLIFKQDVNKMPINFSLGAFYNYGPDKDIYGINMGIIRKNKINNKISISFSGYMRMEYFRHKVTYFLPVASKKREYVIQATALFDKLYVFSAMNINAPTSQNDPFYSPSTSFKFGIGVIIRPPNRNDG